LLAFGYYTLVFLLLSINNSLPVNSISKTTNLHFGTLLIINLFFFFAAIGLQGQVSLKSNTVELLN